MAAVPENNNPSSSKTDNNRSRKRRKNVIIRVVAMTVDIAAATTKTRMSAKCRHRCRCFTEQQHGGHNPQGRGVDIYTTPIHSPRNYLLIPFS